MFERYGESARRALFFARYDVTRLGGETIEPEHLVLGVLQGSPQAIMRFVRAGETAERLKTKLEASSARTGRVESRVEVPFSPATIKVLERTPIEADDLKNHWIRPEHLIICVMVLRDH